MNILMWGVDYLASFVETYMCCIFLGTFLDREKLEESKYPVIWCSIVGAFLVIVLNSIELFSYFTTVLFLALMIVFNFVLYRKKLMVCILLAIYMVILSAIDFGIASCAAYVTGVNVDGIMNQQSIIRIYCILISKAILSIITVFTNNITRKNKFISRKYMVILAICAIFIMLSNFILLEISEASNSQSINIFSIVYFVASLLIIILIFYLITAIAVSYEKNQTMTLIQMKNDMLQKSLDETEKTFSMWRQSVHDYKNNIIALSSLAKKKDIQAIEEYLSSEREKLNAKTFYIKTGNSVIDVIVNTKQNIALNRGINFIVNAGVSEDLQISALDMSSMLGNLIDNAIEASINEQNPEINLNIKEKKNFLIIEISNNFTGEFDQNCNTTKKDKALHGIGMKSIRSTVQKYSGEFSIDKKYNKVCAVVIIPINKRQ